MAPVCDRKVMPDPDLYSECLRAAFAELRQAASVAFQPPRKTGSVSA